MMSFACKRIELSELFRCSFELNKTEYNVLQNLLEKESPTTVSELSENMNLERTTIQKALNSLLEKDLAMRMQENLRRGGYVFFYKPEDKDEIKRRLKNISTDWFARVENEISSW